MHDRAKIIELNDQLRTTFKGGRVQMTPGVYELDERLRGRALCVMSRYKKFDDDSEHDCGVLSLPASRSSGALSTAPRTALAFRLTRPTPNGLCAFSRCTPSMTNCTNTTTRPDRRRYVGSGRKEILIFDA